MAGVIRGQSPLILAFENAPQLCCGDIYLLFTEYYKQTMVKNIVVSRK